jgi:hypothetical protein
MMKERTLAWLYENKNVWRVAILVVVLGAFAGPWAWDLMWVPSEFSCSAPNVRLDGDFCGVPLPGMQLFSWMANGFVYSSTGLVTGALGWIEWAREFLFGFFLLLLILPFFSTSLLIVHGDHRRRQVFSVAAWGLAAGISLLIGMSNYPRLFWLLWGLWIYIGLAAGALILEMHTLAVGRRPSQG